MKAFLKGLGIVVALIITGMILATVAPQVGVWVGLAFLVVPLVAVFKPLPQLYLGNRAFSASVAFFVGLIRRVLRRAYDHGSIFRPHIGHAAFG
ncbi:hypothetical protein [Actibacterium sp. D379-3]